MFNILSSLKPCLPGRPSRDNMLINSWNMFTWKYDTIKPFGNLLKECVFFAAGRVLVQVSELILHIPFNEIQSKRHILERSSFSNKFQ